jgi:microcystin-dependent protein
MSLNALRVQLGPFFDRNELQQGACLYHYQAGTNTEQDIYDDRLKASPLPQPMRSDANGIFNFYADGLLKLVICRGDSTGPTDGVLYTLNNWQFLDPSDPSLSEGTALPSASVVSIGPEVFTHLTGNVDITQLVGTVPFFWAVFDGTIKLIHSAVLILPDAANRIMRPGETAFFLHEDVNTYRLAGYWSRIPAKQTDVASAATIIGPTDHALIDITGIASISAVTPQFPGYEFLARCTGAGLNLIAGSHLFPPWQNRDYLTIPNELLRFVQVNATDFYVMSLNGPKERVGVTIEANVAAAPAGYLDEDGTAISRTTYSGLFQEIGTQFGVGDGSTTFNKPDSRGRTTVNVDGAANRMTAASVGGGNADTLGGAGGEEMHTLAASELASHHHQEGMLDAGDTLQVVYGDGGFDALNADPTNATFGSAQATKPIFTDFAGGGGGHSNTQPWIAKKKFIRF